VRRMIVAASVLFLLPLTAPPASAASVSIGDYFFSPTPVKVPQGGSLSWHNGGGTTHTSTQNGPLSLWNTGNVASGATSGLVTIQAAGVYAYHCTIHAFMTGTVKVPIKVSPSSGSTSTRFTIALAAASQSGFSFDVQKKFGAHAWKLWKTGVTRLKVSFTPSRTGRFRFRSRLHRSGTTATSGWSPAKTITIS